MLTFYDSRNQPHVLGAPLGRGGEGAVFSCADFNLVAKIYDAPVSREKAEKLRWMAANKNEQLLKVAAWIVDVLRDAPNESGKVVGFLMPNVKAKEIHELYSLKSRRVHFPEATWRFLVHTAANLARAFYTLHKHAHVMGDVNHGNCVVLADGTVKLIDCDSYSVKTDKMRYKCEVGTATHLAPELQGANLRAVERLERHDNFGLAVIIFQLLFLGRHPFAGNYLGDADKSLEDCIREYRFAYGAGAAQERGVRQPSGTLPLEAASPAVARLFERAFLTVDNRPEPREWVEALEDLEHHLEQCKLHPGHFFFTELAACPWCEIEAQTGLILFPIITSASGADGEKPFNIFTIENLIASLGIAAENNLPAKAAKLPAVLPTPEIIQERRDRRTRAAIIVSAHFFALVFLLMLFGIGAAMFIGVCLVIFEIVFLNNNEKFVRDDLKERLAYAQREWDELEKERARTGIPPNLNEDLTAIEKKIREHRQLQQTGVRQIKLLETEVARRELFKYLRLKPIADADIAGVSISQRKFLIGRGVKTAAEIAQNRLRADCGFDEQMTMKLLEWRGRLEKDFQTNAKSAQATVNAEKTLLIGEITAERRRLEREIERLFGLLRAGSVHFQRQRYQLLSKSEEFAARLAQAKSDAVAFGSGAATTTALVLMTFFVPFFGGIWSAVNTTETVPPRYSSSVGSKAGYDSSSFSGLSSDYFSGKYLPADDITDDKIKLLPLSERQRFAENLNTEAMRNNYGAFDYAKAERQSRLAVRMISDDTRFFNQLGYALYKQEKFAESLSYLNRSLRIENRNSETKIFIGINYLRLQRYADARQILTDVTYEYPNSYEGFYNLGLANAGLKDYGAATIDFQRAVALNPEDADAHYELGLYLSKSGNTQQVRAEYEILLGLDKTTAEKLRRDANLY